MNKKLKIKLKRIYHQYKSYGVRGMIRNRIVYIRRWLLEDKANVGLGGPPNNWSGSPEIVVQDGTKSDPTYRYGYSVHFNNDAHEIWINVFEKLCAWPRRWFTLAAGYALRYAASSRCERI